MSEAGTATVGLIPQADQRPAEVALACGEETRTYGELVDRIRRAALVLRDHGVGEGDRVALMLGNGIEWLEVLHACGWLGAVTVPVNPSFKRGELSWIVSDADARLVVTRPDLADTAREAGAPTLTVGEEYEAALDAAVGTVDVVGVGWPVTMQYTSGTTGRPKGVAIGEGDFRLTPDAILDNIHPKWKPEPDDVHLVAGPLYHAAALFFANLHLAVGATVVIMPRFDAAEALALIERHGVSTTQMVPAHFTRILALPDDERDARDTSSLRLVLHAGAPCPVDVKRRTMALFDTAEIWEYYGASEGGGVVIGPDEWLERPGSVGRPQPGTEFKIVGEDGEELPPGEIGTLYVRGDRTSFRYHNDPDKTARAYESGTDWFSVGDTGYVDADGYLYLTGRRTDLVVTGGVNVYPAEVEDCLHEHPEIVDCAVFGVPDDDWGQAVAAAVQVRPGAPLSADDVEGWVRERLADFKRPRRVWFVDDLPRTAAGKVRKHVLRDELLQRTGA